MAKCISCGKKHPFLKVDQHGICINCYAEQLNHVITSVSLLTETVHTLEMQLHDLNTKYNFLRLEQARIKEQFMQQEQPLKQNEFNVSFEEESDARLEEATKIVIEAGQASVSMLQRRMRVGYSRAGRLIDELQRRGIVSEADGAKPRKVLITPEQFDEIFV